MTSNDNKNKGPESPQDILKRIETESAEKKREKTLNILSREQPAIPRTLWWQLAYKNLKGGYEKTMKSFIKMSSIKQNRHIAIITAFFMGAMWVSWQIEDKFDKLRRRARSSKSMKEKQVQSQNEYIQKMLRRNPFSPVPIEEEEQQNASYIFQKADIEFDTRADLLEVLEEEKQLLYQDPQ